MRMSLLSVLSLSLSLRCITPFLHTVFQSTKTLGSIRAEQKGYDKVSHTHCPVPLSLSSPVQDSPSTTSKQGRERETRSSTSICWAPQNGEEGLQPIRSLWLSRFSLSFSHAVRSLHFSLHLSSSSLLLVLALSSAELMCWVCSILQQNRLYYNVDEARAHTQSYGLSQ